MVNIEEFELNIDDTIDSIAVPLSLSMTQCCSPQPWFKHYSGCTFLTLSMYKMMFFINLEGNQFNRSAHSYQMWPIEEITTMLVARLSCRPMGGLDTLSQLAGRGYNTIPTSPCPATLKMRPKFRQAFSSIGLFLPIRATIPTPTSPCPANLGHNTTSTRPNPLEPKFGRAFSSKGLLHY